MKAIRVDCLTVEIELGGSVQLTTRDSRGRRQCHRWRLVVGFRRPGQVRGRVFTNVTEADPCSGVGCICRRATALGRDADGTDFGRRLDGRRTHGRC